MQSLCARLGGLGGQQLAHGREHGVEHLRRQPARIRIVARAMEAIDELQAGPQGVARAVREGKLRLAEAQRRQRAVVRDAPQRDHRRHIGQRRDARPQEAAAGGDLRRRRLVLRRHAAHRIGDDAVDELQAVVGARLVAPAGEAELQQRCVEEIAGVVAGERSPGAIGAVEARREADDQQPAGFVAERGDRAVDTSRAPCGGCRRERQRAVGTGAHSFGASGVRASPVTAIGQTPVRPLRRGRRYPGMSRPRGAYSRCGRRHCRPNGGPRAPDASPDRGR